MAYQAFTQINNTMNLPMNDVVLIHVWPNGYKSDIFTWPAIPALSNSPLSTLPANSGSGAGFDYWTLIFSLDGGSGPRAYAMVPTICNLTSSDERPTFTFVVEPDHQVTIINPLAPDAAGSWADAATVGFLSAGATPVAASVQPETATPSARA